MEDCSSNETEFLIAIRTPIFLEEYSSEKI